MGRWSCDVCRQILGDRHHAEDAFQAVFLVLARKAISIREPDLLSAWLYGVAIRTARKVQARLARLRRNEESDSMNGPSVDSSVLVDSTATSADESAIAREQAEALHDEIDRLPRSFRLPVVLCYFQDLTLDEVARRLQCPAGTVRSRLARARDKVRRALIRRGVVLPSAAMAAALSPRSASASVSSALCDATTRAAVRFAAGQAVSPLATVLAQEVLKSMLVNKLRLTALSLLLFGALATGAGYWNHSLAAKEEGKSTPAVRQSLAVDEPNHPVPAPGRMTVTGSVLDPAGKPMPGISVELIGRPRGPAVAREEWRAPYVLLGRGTTGAGRPLSLRRRAHITGRLPSVPGPGRGPWLRPRLGRAQSRRRAARR